MLAREYTSDLRGIHQRQWQGERGIAVVVVMTDAKMVPARQEQGDDGMAPDQHRQGKGNAAMVLPKR
jgi:hypothetical protein